MFSILALKIGFEGDKISRKKTDEPILRAKIENMISPDYALCYIPQASGNFGKTLDFFWKILNSNFQSRKQIMTAIGVYIPIFHERYMVSFLKSN